MKKIAICALLFSAFGCEDTRPIYSPEFKIGQVVEMKPEGRKAVISTTYTSRDKNQTKEYGLYYFDENGIRRYIYLNDSQFKVVPE